MSSKSNSTNHHKNPLMDFLVLHPEPVSGGGNTIKSTVK